MKKGGILNHQIMQVITMMGHGESLVIADAGLPIPAGVPRIDLALVAGVPGFMETLKAVLGELQVESAMVAQEMGLAMHQAVAVLVGATGKTESVPHEEFKRLTRGAVAVIRTGECTPYANVILRAGVTF